jgi:hypothetical protein
LGVFVSADKVQGPNRYAYAGNNPISNTDPSGNFCVPCIIGIAALAGIMSTSPMGSSAADTPGEIAQVEQWRNSGGPEFNYAMSRMIPGFGQTLGASELLSGQDILGRDVSTLSQVLNTVDVAGFGIVNARKFDSFAGELNTTIQQKRIMNLKGATEIFPQGVDRAQDAAYWGNIRGMTTVAANKLGLNEVAIYSGEETAAIFKGGAGGYYRSADKSIALTWNFPGAAPHEIVHAMQDASGHPLYSVGRTLKNRFDAEIMAYAGTNLRNVGITRQVASSLWSANYNVKSPFVQRVSDSLNSLSRCNCNKVVDGAGLMNYGTSVARAVQGGKK